MDRIIRTATLADLDAVAAVEAACFPAAEAAIVRWQKGKKTGRGRRGGRAPSDPSVGGASRGTGIISMRYFFYEAGWGTVFQPHSGKEPDDVLRRRGRKVRIPE